jgi:glycosyltransferase involved in cell wall biosynthesis
LLGPWTTVATVPYFIFSPSTILSLAGLLRGPDKTTPAPADDWRAATVDVVIPARNEADNIVLCLASVARQTLRPRRIILVDDGSQDGTIARAKAFCAMQGLDLIAIQRRAPIGKTPTIKRQAREFDSDVEFILDADTVLDSDNYIERTVQELYQGVGIASACGTILPQRSSDRLRSESTPEVRAYFGAQGIQYAASKRSQLARLRRGVTNLYREVLYLYLQRFVYRGQMAMFGTTTNPVGCAVAYRRKYVRDLFDYVGPILGDDLTNSEDIFIGFSMLNEGYRNIQLTDVYARTVEPEIQKLPKQVYLWSSSFLQCCYYFDTLVRSPFSVAKRWFARRRPARTSVTRPLATAPGPLSLAAAVPVGAGLGSPSSATFALGGHGMPVSIATAVATPTAVAADDRAFPQYDRRVAREPYRQAFGRARTRTYGRPAGWIVLMAAVEKVFFPTVLLLMLILRNWEGLAVTVGFETAVCLVALAIVMKGARLEYVFKGLVVTPIRYALLAMETLTIGRFAFDLWITGNRSWRK